MLSEEALIHIVHGGLPDQLPVDTQDEHTVTGLLQLFSNFLECILSDESNDSSSWEDLDEHVLASLRAATSDALSSKVVHWMTKYGAALLFYPLKSCMPKEGTLRRLHAEKSIVLLALDSFSFRGHSCEAALLTHLAYNDNHALLSTSPPLQQDKLATFLNNLNDLEQEIFRNLDNGGKLQRTPAFAHGMVQIALDLTARGVTCMEAVKAKELPQVQAKGGTTDVGRHTGSEARDVCWGLAREVLRVSLFKSLFTSC